MDSIVGPLPATPLLISTIRGSDFAFAGSMTGFSSLVGHQRTTLLRSSTAIRSASVVSGNVFAGINRFLSCCIYTFERNEMG